MGGPSFLDPPNLVYYSTERDLTVPIPMHPGDVLKGTLRTIIREVEITVEEFNAI